MPKPIAPSARRTDSDPLYDQADAIVVRWIAREDPPPAVLADAVKRFQILDVQLSIEDKPDYSESNRVYNRLLHAALLKLRVHFEVTHQARRLQRRNEARLTYQQKCDRAIAQWRANA